MPLCLSSFLPLSLCTSGGNYAEISMRKKMYLAGRIRLIEQFKSVEIETLYIFPSEVLAHPGRYPAENTKESHEQHATKFWPVSYSANFRW
jgi:hypothetical protein